MVRLHHPATKATVEVPLKAVKSHAKRGWVRVDAAPAPARLAKPEPMSAPGPVEEPDHEVKLQTADPDDRMVLLELADELGVPVDRRWGVARLNEAIAAHAGDEPNVPEGDDYPTPSQED